MADKNIRLAWAVTTSYTTVVTPEELRLVLLEALSASAPDRGMWDQGITNASPQELADLASDLTLSRTASAFENWLAARASNNHGSDGADEFDACETEETDDDPD